MRRILHASWVVCFMVLCLATAVQASETEPVIVPSAEAGWSGPFRLGAGDVLNVFIWKHKGFPSALRTASKTDAQVSTAIRKSSRGC